MAIHSSTLAWKIPWMEEPGRLQSMGSQRVGHDGVTSLSLFLFFLSRYCFKYFFPSFFSWYSYYMYIIPFRVVLQFLYILFFFPPSFFFSLYFKITAILNFQFGNFNILVISEFCVMLALSL